MFVVKVTRTNARGITYAQGVIAGPYPDKEWAEKVKDELAATDGNVQLGQKNKDSTWEVIPYEPCETCNQAEDDLSFKEHTC